MIYNRKIKLMAEYNSSPLWDMETADNLELEELPLSGAIRQRLNDWARVYDRLLNWDDPADSAFPDPAAREAFDREGTLIWQQLQAELSPDYQVFYFSEKHHRLLIDRERETERSSVETGSLG